MCMRAFDASSIVLLSCHVPRFGWLIFGHPLFTKHFSNCQSHTTFTKTGHSVPVVPVLNISGWHGQSLRYLQWSINSRLAWSTWISMQNEGGSGWCYGNAGNI